MKRLGVVIHSYTMKNTTSPPRRKLTDKQKYFQGLRREWLALEKETGGFSFLIAHETLPRKTWGWTALEEAPERTAKEFMSRFSTEASEVPPGALFNMKYGHKFVVISIIRDPYYESKDGRFYYVYAAKRIKHQPSPYDVKGDWETIEEFKNERTPEDEFRAGDMQRPRPNCPKLHVLDSEFDVFNLANIKTLKGGQVSRIFAACYSDQALAKGTRFSINQFQFFVGDSMLVERPGRDSYVCVEGIPAWLTDG